jgi:hypothetical protein
MSHPMMNRIVALLKKTTVSASLVFVTSVAVDAATITIPTVLTGDVVIFCDMPARNTSGSPPAVVTPTATGITFTPLVQFPVSGDAGGDTRNVVQSWHWAFLANSADSAKVITGANHSGLAGFRRKILLVFRRTPVATGFNAFESASKVWASGDPTPTSTALSAGTAPFVAIAAYRGEAALVSPTFSETSDGDILSGTTAQVSYKIYNAASSATLAADQGDGGASQITISYLLEITG